MFFLLIPKQESVTLHQLADEYDGIESHNTIAHDAGNIVGLGVVLPLQEYLIPHGGHLSVVLLEFVEQFVLALTNLI